MGTDLAPRQLAWARKQWRRSERGSWFVNARGFNIVVFGSRKGWGIRVVQHYGDCHQFGRKRYATRAEAQRAAFDALLWCEQHGHGNGRHPVAPQGARA